MGLKKSCKRLAVLKGKVRGFDGASMGICRADGVKVARFARSKGARALENARGFDGVLF